MVIGLLCNCHGSPGLFRQFLFENHVPNYMMVPTRQGDKAKDWAKSTNLTAVYSYTTNHSSYVLILGWSKSDFSDLEWADVNNSNPEIRLRAEMILERFA